MENIIRRMDTLEAEILILNEEKHRNKVTIKLLESRLLKSEQQIKELEKRKEKPIREAEHGIKKEEFKKIGRRMSDLERQQQQLQRQCRDVHDDFQRLDKLQLLINNILLQKAKGDNRDKTSDVDSLRKNMDVLNTRSGVISSQMDMLKKKCDLMYQHVGIELEYDMTRNLIKKHRVAMSYDDVREMAALEKIANNPDGPAFKILTNICRGDADMADSRRQDNVKKLQGGGISSPDVAKKRYVNNCNSYQTELPSEAEFHQVMIPSGRRILAIDNTHLRFLDRTSKKTLESWQLDEIRDCRILEGDRFVKAIRFESKIALSLSLGLTLTFCTDEHIDKDVCQLIRSLIGK